MNSSPCHLQDLHEDLSSIDGHYTGESCAFCGHPEFAKLVEIWGPREFMIETCCEYTHEVVNEFLNEDPKRAGEWLGKALRANELGGSKVRRVIADGGQLLIDWHLQVVPIGQRAAKDFIRTHHRHCPPPAGWRFGAAVRNGPGDEGIVAVAMCGRPVARHLDQKRIVEVNRLCSRTDVASELTWNACSLLYGWCARKAKALGAEHIISYTLASEAGTTLKAAGWTVDGRVGGRHWDTPSRRRHRSANVEDKVRWARTLVRKPISKLPGGTAGGARAGAEELLAQVPARMPIGGCELARAD
ncbi:XF1762 family protein [Rubrivivax gelatinosus]|uniref:XF1762 family protein n=1 Tax=Rubrivivax gelatinosus TaxID=28068 RepID=UPI001872B31B|nr:XF1762 family protein [Rubrivivax gelatinosus]MBG6083112.1 uncharacterized protein YacL (UPF0231 family) [Rubrivivax gelatinosus]